MTTTVFLVRHGQTDSNLNDFYMGWSAEDLNKTGYTQVQRLALRLASQPIATVYVSPLQRALTTANIIAGPHGLIPRIRQDLIEIKLGNWEGLSANEIKQKWPELFEQWRKDPSDITLPGGESVRHVTERSIRVVKTIVDDNPDKTVLLVTHEIIIKVVIPYVLGCTNEIYRRFRVSNASLSIITHFDGNFRLITLNDTSHLEGPVAP